MNNTGLNLKYELTASNPGDQNDTQNLMARTFYRINETDINRNENKDGISMGIYENKGNQF